jgi:AhpD family alkylhydroperoxidase
MEDSFLASLKSAKTYGLGEFLEIIGELSQESTKKGSVDRQTKELITFGIALAKGCKRCIKIHRKAAEKLKASPAEIEQIKRTYLFLKATPGPGDDEDLWESWEQSWLHFVLGKSDLKHYEVELVALGIGLVKQSGRHIKLHTANALKFGATRQQVFEVMPIALLMDGAPALSQIPKLVKALEASQETP